MALPHPDRSQPSPWTDWPASFPEPVTVRSIEQVDSETRNVYMITMPNGATHAIWWVINSWDGDYEICRTPGDWSPYGLAFNDNDGLLEGAGSGAVYDAVEEWADQDRGKPCPTCHCSGRMLVLNQSAGLSYLLAPKYDWDTCPTCLGMAWVPHTPS